MKFTMNTTIIKLAVIMIIFAPFCNCCAIEQHSQSQDSQDKVLVQATGHGRTPILIIHGLLTSELDVKNSNFWCNTFSKYTKMWLNLVRLPICHSELKLQYDSSTNTYHNESRVEIIVPNFGDVDSVTHVGGHPQFPLFYKMVNYLRNEHGYTDLNLKAAPYDWRLAPSELERLGYYEKVKTLIEKMYQANENSPVSLIIHSMGGPVALHFLTSGIVRQEWKDKYIANFIPLAGAWSGANFALHMLVSAKQLEEGVDSTDSANIFTSRLSNSVNSIGDVLARILRDLSRSLQSVYFMMPRASLWKDTVLIETPSKNYTANDYKQLFADLDYYIGYVKFHGIENINPDWPAPNVPTYCFYGVDLDTPESFVYSKDFPDITHVDVTVVNGDGDGVVNTINSEVCLQWRSSGYPFTEHRLSGIDHYTITMDDVVLKAIGAINHPKA